MNMLHTSTGGNAPAVLPVPHGRLEKHRVLMTLDAVGGVWRYAMELARGLLAQNVAVVFAGLGPDPSREQVEEASRLGKLIWLEEPLDWIAPDEKAVKTLPAKLGRIAEEEGVNLLHLNLPSQAAGIDTDLPVLVVSHSCVVTWWQTMRMEAFPKQWEWMRRMNAAGMQRADAVVAPSGSHAQALMQGYGEPCNLSVVHNAISAFLQGVRKEPFVFAAARWWDEGKNGQVLDEAAASTSWPVLMAGSVEGPNGQAAPKIANAQPLGVLPHNRILAQLRRAGIVVSPSLYEPFGLSVLEGARAGAALVLSDIPTYRELWSEAAVFFDPKDPQTLSAAIDRLATDCELRVEIGTRALARSRRFTPNVQAHRMRELYDQLIETTVEGVR